MHNRLVATNTKGKVKFYVPETEETIDESSEESKAEIPPLVKKTCLRVKRNKPSHPLEKMVILNWSWQKFLTNY